MLKWKKTTIAGLMVAGMGMTACGSCSGTGSETTTCPESAPVRCPDESCAESTALCAAPAPVAMTLIGPSERSVLAARPEPLELYLNVDDVDELERQIDAGGFFQVEVSTPFTTATFEAEPKGRPESDETIGNYNFRIEVGPEAQSGPMRGEMVVRWIGPEGTAMQIGTERLHYRGEPSALEYPSRDGFEVSGTNAPTKAWAPDLDGDGVEDLVLLDVDDEGNDVLRVFSCDERCEPAGERPIPSADVKAHLSTSLDETGFLAALPEYGDDGSILTVSVEHLVIGPDGDLDVTSAEMTFNELPQLQWSSAQPRLLLDRAGAETRPGLTIQQRVTAREIIWSTVTLDASGVVSQQEEFRTPPGNEPELFSALQNAPFTQCSQGEMTLDISAKSAGAVAMTFQSSQGAELILGATDPAIAPLQRVSLDGVWDASDGRLGSVSCRLADLNGDGEPDLVAALAEEGTYDGFAPVEGRRAKLVTIPLRSGGSSSMLAGRAALIGDVDADSWSLTKGESSWLLRTRHELSGEDRATHVELEPCTECEDFEFEVRAIPPSIAGLEVTAPNNSVVAWTGGNDTIVRKKPGRTTYGWSSPNGGALQSTSQVITTDGTWIVARYGEGLRPSEGAEAFIKDDSGSVFGFLPNDGEFVELRNSDEGSPLHEATSVSGESVLYEMEQSSSGETTITAWNLEVTAELSLNDDPTVITLEGVAGKKVVKFKAGAELSKSIAAPDGGGDCDDDDTCPRPGTFVALQFDDGTVATTTLDLTAGTATELANAPLDTQLENLLGGAPERTDLWVGDLGAGPVALLRGSLDGRSAIAGTTPDGNRVDFVTETGVSLDISRTSGTHTSQLVTCDLAGDEAYCEESSMTDGGAFSSVRWMAPESIRDRQVTNVIDVDGDDCADLVVDRTILVSSRCGLGFAEPTTLDSWSLHLAAAPATSHNASRSNRSSIASPDGEGGGNNDGSHAVAGAIPFFDGFGESY